VEGIIKTVWQLSFAEIGKIMNPFRNLRTIKDEVTSTSRVRPFHFKSSTFLDF
jgi:hypothetical protein